MPVVTIPQEETVTAVKNPDFIRRIRGILEERRAQALARSLRPVPGHYHVPFNGDFADQSSGETELRPQLCLAQREQRLVTKINAAFDRIKAGTYGICEECSYPIEEERLLARPVTTLCIDCKREQEELENGNVN